MILPRRFAWALALAACTLLAMGPRARAAEAQAYYLMVFGASVPGQEEAFNQWYTNHHARDVVAVPGFVSARRYVINDVQLRAGGTPPAKYLALYKIVTDDLTAVLAEVNRRLSSGETKLSPTLDPKSLKGWIYQVIRPPVLHEGIGQAPTDEDFIQLVFGNAMAGQDDAFNRWYDEHHAPDVVAVPGFVSGQRLQAAAVKFAGEAPTKYLVIFRAKASDFAKVAADFQTRAPKMSMSPAFDGSTTQGYTYRALGPLIEGDAVRAERLARKPAISSGR